MKKKLYFRAAAFVLGAALLLFSGCQTSDTEKQTDTTNPLVLTGWKPDAGEPWNFTPTLGNVGEDAEKYDFEITLEQTVYSGVPDSISYTLVNKTGEPFYTCGEFIEKAYSNPFPPYFDEVSAAWIRIPYYRTPIWAYCPDSEVDGKIILSQFLEEDFTFTPGDYRIIFFLSDGPHYVYFEIMEP